MRRQPVAALLALLLVTTGCAAATDDDAAPSPASVPTAGPELDDGLIALVPSSRFEGVGGDHEGGEPVEAEPFTYDASASDCGIGERYGTAAEGVDVTGCALVSGGGGPFVVASLRFTERESDDSELWVACGGPKDFSPARIAIAAAANLGVVFATTEEQGAPEAALITLTLPDDINDLSLFFSVVASETDEPCPRIYDLETGHSFEIDISEQHGSARMSYAGGGETTCVFRTEASTWVASVRDTADQPC